MILKVIFFLLIFLFSNQNTSQLCCEDEWFEKNFPARILRSLLRSSSFFQMPVFARTTPNDTYQAKREMFYLSLDFIKDSSKKDTVIQVDKQLVETNQQISLRFEEDVNKLAAIMQEIKARMKIEDQPTVVAFGTAANQIEAADYSVNFAAEAVAFQKIQDYTPVITTESNLSGPISSSVNRMKADFSVLRGKVLRAKSEVSKVLSL